MFIVLEIEVKINYQGKLEYLQNNIIGKAYSFEEANRMMDNAVIYRVNAGYFDKILCQRDGYATLTNGGTAYLKYEVITINS